MTDGYQPELGQAIFGAPYAEFGIPPNGEASIRMVLDEMERVYGNRYQQREMGFGSNDGFVMPDGALGPDISYRSYYWGNDEPEVNRPNLTFDGVEVRWYKHARRGLSCNKSMTPAEWPEWLRKALAYLGEQDDPASYIEFKKPL